MIGIHAIKQWYLWYFKQVNNPLRLATFAYHVSAITRAHRGDVFTLHYGGEEGVKVRHDYDSGLFEVNDKCVGNVQGAIQEYADIVGETLEIREKYHV